MIIEWPGNSRTVDETTSFLLTNNNGGFAFFPTIEADSRFQGVHFMKKQDVFKVIDSIRLVGALPDRLLNKISKVERHSAQAVETFWMNDNVLSYTVDNHKGPADLSLDCRKIYDYRTNGRIYNIQKEKDYLVISYDKFTDDNLQNKDYSIYVVIKGISEFQKIDEWHQMDYDYDRLRKSEPSNAYVYHALRFIIDGSAKLVFSYSTDLHEAMRQAEHNYQNLDYIEKSMDTKIGSLTKTEIDACPEILNAYKSSLQALDGYMVEKGDSIGLIAGCPWFTQIWSRDEAISLGAIIKEKRYDDYNKIFYRQLTHIDNEGRIPNRFPGSDLGSSDAIGWFWFRFHDFLKHLEKDDKLSDYFNENDLLSIRKKLQNTLDNLRSKHTVDGLAVNKPLETWMDTNYKDDVRAGARIEIQALRLAMYNCMVKLCKLTGEEVLMHSYREVEHVMAKHVKAVFWNKPVLFDGKDDPTLRPNIFLANYVYPHLLNKSEWKTAFDKAVSCLYLDWGGLSTIDKNHKYFIDHYTGEDNRSYHRGDSWFFVNNMAAICMFRLDKNKYAKYIRKILSASTQEILYSGIIGHHAEVSDAKKLCSRGSLSQCWSSALFIELCHQLQFHHQFLQTLID